MKVAVLFTGALRTIKKTMRYFKQNVLVNPDVDIFACVQNDTNIPNSEWEEWIRQEMGSHLKHLLWFTPSEHQNWFSHRDNMLSHLNLLPHWKNYLRNSGSMIEYYQLYLSYLKMCQYEDIHYRFDFIIRTRTDSIFAKPINFHWLNWTDDEVQQRLDKINNQLSNHNIPITPINTLQYFMTTIISDDIISNVHNISAENVIVPGFNIPQTNLELNTFIKNGAYILTLRVNNLYIVRRDLFNLVPTLPYIYGFLKAPHHNKYWFNAESQFQAACYFSGINIFNYCTEFDNKSLYEYDEQRYFDSNYDFQNPYMLFCVVRY